MQWLEELGINAASAVVLGFYVYAAVEFDDRLSTTSLSIFVVAVSLAACCFSYSRALLATPEEAAEILSCGESFLLATLNGAFGAAAKVLMYLVAFRGPQAHFREFTFWQWMAGLPVLALLMLSYRNLNDGVRRLARVLLHRRAAR